MTRNLEDVSGLPIPDAKVLNDIRTYGWHVTGVFATGNETGSDWAFSIGLFHSFMHPEVIIAGLRSDTCMSVINEIGREIKGGKHYEAGKEYDDILDGPYKCAFRPVLPEHYEGYLGFALWFYQDDPFPVLQCFWPDKAGKFPWDEDCNAFVRSAQPFLFAARRPIKSNNS